MSATRARRGMAPHGLTTEAPPGGHPTVTAVALYARVSTEDQAERDTIATQLDFLRRLATLHGLPVAGEYRDDGVSGTIPLGQRPDGRRLLEDAEAGRFGQVIFMRVSRLGRKLAVLLDAHDALDRLGVAIRSGTEPLDTATPIGRFIFQLLGSVAELDRETIGEQTTRGRNRVAAKGRYVGGAIPFGYDVDADGGYVPATRPVPGGGTEADLVREVFRRIADGVATLNGECARLTALGVPCGRRYGGKEARFVVRAGGWGTSSLGTILHNPIYMGAQTIASRYGEVPHPTPVLVDRATWERAQTALVTNRSLARKNATHDYLLRGLVRCADCGRSYVGTAGRGVRGYRCNGGNGRADGAMAHRCPAKILSADWLEEAVWAQCAAFIRNPGKALAEAQRKLRARLADAAGAPTRRRDLLATLAAKEGERERVLALYRRGTITDAEAERELDAVAREAGHLRADLEALRAQEALVAAQETDLADATALLATVRDQVDAIEATDDRDRKRAIIRRYVRAVEVHTRRVGPRTLAADVRVYLRLQPEPVAVESVASPRCDNYRTAPAIEIERLLTTGTEAPLAAD